MTAVGPEGGPSRPWPRRRWRLLGLAAALAAAAAALFVARNFIAQELARRWLEARHVPAGFQISALSLTGLTARVRLGPSADPDLTIERLSVAYGLSLQHGRLVVTTHSISLWRPRLKLRLGPDGLSFGSLDTLVREIESQPAAPGPAPDVTVESGVATLATPLGTLTFEGGGALREGRLSAADVRVAAFALKASGMTVSSAGETLNLERRGDRLAASMDGGPLVASDGDGRLQLDSLAMSADLPAPTAAWRLAGPAHLALAATGSGRLTRAGKANGRLQTVFQGVLTVDPRRQGFDGGLTAQLQASDVDAGAVSGRDVEADLDFARFTAAHDERLTLAVADGAAAIRSAGVRLGDAALRGEARVRIEHADFRSTPSGLTGDARFGGSIAGQGALAPSQARLWAAKTPILGGEPRYRAALEAVLRGFRITAPAWEAEISNGRARLRLAAPAALEAASGARLTLGGHVSAATGARPTGDADLAMGGGGLPTAQVQLRSWSETPTGLEAETVANGAFDMGVVRGAEASVRGRARLDGDVFRFDLAACAPLSARRLAIDPNPVLDVSARLCPLAAPLVIAGPAGWRISGQIQSASGRAPSAGATFADARGPFSIAGEDVGAQIATVALDHARVADSTEPARFRPLDAHGRLTLARGRWLGDFVGATPAGQKIVSLKLRQDEESGAGGVDIESRLVFAPGALQPAALSPGLSFARDVAGEAAFTGQMAWDARGAVSSGGELKAPSLTFKSPAGTVTGLATDFKFASLAPLASAPGQEVSAAKIEGSIPLEHLSARLGFDAQALRIEAASADFSGGRVSLEPMTAPLASGQATSGVVVFDHVNLGQVIADSNLSRVVKMDAIVNARVPFQVGPSGVAIAGGKMVATGPGRLSIARSAFTGIQPSGPAQGAAGGTGAAAESGGLARDLAFQAMENLAFDTLDAELNSYAGDRLRILFHIKGRHQPPKPQRAQIALGDLLSGKALQKPIPLPSNTPINLTLDTTLNFGELVRELGEVWREALGGGEGRSAPVQRSSPSMPTK
jgi:hypothetical protein